MPRHKTSDQSAPRSNDSAASQLETVSARWLLTTVGLALLASAACAWGALCFMFWQGSWQLLYHPAAPVTRTPASIGLPFDPVGFATTDAGEPRLKGWWIPAAPDARYSRYTVLYLHGKDGNLSDTVFTLGALHAVGVNVLAFDYRGYGQSEFVRPSEARWREDAESALQYLIGTRHVSAASILLDGRDLGANLALATGAAHPELGGVILQHPLEAPVEAIFHDPRARLVPAHMLVRDRFDLNAPAAGLRISSLWLYRTAAPGAARLPEQPQAFKKIAAPKMLVWLTIVGNQKKDYAAAVSRWLDSLPTAPAVK